MPAADSDAELVADSDAEQSVQEEVVAGKKSRRSRKKEKKAKAAQNPELKLEAPATTDDNLLGKRPRRKSSLANGDCSPKPKPAHLGAGKKLIVNPISETTLGRRVKIEHLSDVNLGIKDNSFATKLATGGIDEYGKFGFQKLGGQQGKEFRKQKNKLKNKAFAGETIVHRDNSFLLS